MRTLFFDCGMGAAGDMLAAALYELLAEEQRASFLETMSTLIPGVSFQAERSVKCGVAGTHILVEIHGETEPSADTAAYEPIDPNGQDHHHREIVEHSHGQGLNQIRQVIFSLKLPVDVKENMWSVYRLLAAAESEAHGEPVDRIHFHEVGELDAIADIAAVCLLLHTLAPERIVASPVHVGFGQVRCAHGILPVPAPATAILLKGVPIYSGTIRGELCTPTGAALLKHFCTFGAMPQVSIQSIGYGMGTKDFEAANCVRALLGEADETAETISELCCNLDDMTPEAIGFALERLWEGPILDAFTSPIGMKKNRPGILLTCLCRKEDTEPVVRLLFRHTATLGVRQRVCSRYTLARSICEVSISGEVFRVKCGSGWGVQRKKAEYEDAARFARANNLPFAEASEIILRASQDQLVAETNRK